MALINFPDSPTLDQVFTSGSRSWKWNGSAWDKIITSGTIAWDDVSGKPDFGDASTLNAGELIEGYVPVYGEDAILTASGYFAGLPTGPVGVYSPEYFSLSSDGVTSFLLFISNITESRTVQAANASGTMAITANTNGIPDMFIPPTSDPHVAGAMWWNGSALVRSTG